MSNPLTLLQHQWVAIEVSEVAVFRKRNGEIVAVKDEDDLIEVQLGCRLCDATPEEGWGTVCPGEEV